MSSDNLSPSYALPSETTSIADLFNQKPKTLRTSLEVMTLEIFERMRIRKLNLERIDEEKQKLYDMLQTITIQVNYHLRDGKDKQLVYQQLFALRQETREQDVNCWKDIVLVLHAMLPIWQEHEQAKARAKMLRGM